uniref:Uncharacterized protein n=1 Tax=Anopheles farauti TaxID=69004 RepID=A0A182QUR9_9DIPT
MRLFKAKKLLDGPQVLARGGTPTLSPADSAVTANSAAGYNDIIGLTGSAGTQAQSQSATGKYDGELPSLLTTNDELTTCSDTPTDAPVATVSLLHDCNQHPSAEESTTVMAPAPSPSTGPTDTVCSINNASVGEPSHVRNQAAGDASTRLIRDHLRPRTPPLEPSINGHIPAAIGRNGIGTLAGFRMVTAVPAMVLEDEPPLRATKESKNAKVGRSDARCIIAHILSVRRRWLRNRIGSTNLPVLSCNRFAQSRCETRRNAGFPLSVRRPSQFASDSSHRLKASGP